ncbi:hypothetical protein Emag_003763 [Eimeria magna]
MEVEVLDPAGAPFSQPSSSSSSSNSSNSSSSSSNSSNSSSNNSSNSSSSSSAIDSIWIEKYRPQTLDEVVGNDEILQRLRLIALEGNMPHLLLAGPPGTGKTTSVLCLSRQLLQNKWKSCSLELNASDESKSSKQIPRSSRMSITCTSSNSTSSNSSSSSSNNSSSSSSSSIRMLRQKRELSSAPDNGAAQRQHTVCVGLQFFLFRHRASSVAVLDPQIHQTLRCSCGLCLQLVQRLREVCQKENITFTDDGIEALVFSADGDMRNGFPRVVVNQALNNLQSTVSGFGVVNKTNVEKVGQASSLMLRVCDSPPPEMLRRILLHCTAGEWHEVRVYEVNRFVSLYFVILSCLVELSSAVVFKDN